ncbi:MAG: RNA ligase family protein, partial [Nanoarchaeota archaeon]
MSEFAVEVVKIDNVYNHPDADRLTIVEIGGYKCISNKLEDGSWRYQKDDLVVYIPEASVVPEWLMQKMGFWDADKKCGTLSGSRKNRVKAIRLRGIFSQGILYPVYKENENVIKITTEVGLTQYCKLGDNVAEFLGIQKWEPEVPQSMAGVIRGGLFGHTKGYDIENLQKYKHVFVEGEQVVFTEKLHGTLCEIGFSNNFPEDSKEFLFPVFPDDIYGYVTSKGLSKKGIFQLNKPENSDNLYVKAYKKYFEEKAGPIVERFLRLNNLDGRPDIKWYLHIFGEVYGAGVQDLGYNAKEAEFRVFDVYVKIFDPEKEK